MSTAPDSRPKARFVETGDIETRALAFARKAA
jgi:hypothetical protein